MARKLGALDVDPAAIEHVVASLVQTSLRGVDSHGINLFPHYCRAVRAGRINRSPLIAVNDTASAVAQIDADHAFGHHAGAVAVDHATQLAQQHGVGVASVSQSTHFGAAAYFALRAAQRGFLAFSFTNADALVKAFHAREAFFGTNPVCFAAPLAREEPFCLDMATSRVSWNKVKEHRLAGRELPPGWAFDADGEPTRDPELARMLAPTGEYKGYGLGMMVEILCGMLANGPVGKEILPMYTAPLTARRSISHFFMVLDVSRFVPVRTFAERLQGVVDALRALVPESAQVMVPGDPEKQAEVHRREHGIPMSDAVFGEYLELDPAFADAVVS